MDKATWDLQSLATRVEKPEKQNRLFKRGELALLLSASTLIVMGQTPPKKPLFAELEAYADLGSVSADGVWRPDNATKKNQLTEVVVKLECFRQGGKGLVGTEAFCLEASASAPHGMLTVGFQGLKVVEWSDARIIATDDSAICLTSQTIFDLKRKTVTALDIRKLEERGFNNTCDLLPDRQTYYLQDVTDYYVQKQLGAARKLK